ncbi:hypothetical protein K439DRAFT_1374132 [Ramaria rubella]|nr:hypothetical protein K439DRAFT_1375397 [Ramaria rubella]KAF8573845.1 hypothetical protein K439DRAFT_1374132 [Ramaria rubella]
MNLRGIIYHGGYHFTARFIDARDNIWNHDGMQLDGQCRMESNINEINLSILDNRRACIAQL